MKVRLINISNVLNNDLGVELEVILDENNDNLDCYCIFNDNEILCEKVYNGENIYKFNIVINLNYLKTDISFKLKLNDKFYDVEFLNNKDEKLINDGNKFCIFTKRYKVNITSKKFTIAKKDMFSKFRYEIFKLIYGIRRYKKIFILRLFNKVNKEYILFNDRLMYADDNAVALFEYINKNHKDIAKKCYFVLDDKSKDIHKVNKIGNVVIYKSLKHKLLFLNTKILVSSFASYTNPVSNPFTYEEMDMYKDLLTKSFYFLQHGVIMADVSKYLNRCNITADKFVVSTNSEYDYLISNKYLYNTESIVKTGLPRFDKLKNNIKKFIFISPTWRMHLSNLNNDEFMNTKYFKEFVKFISNERFLEKINEYGYTIKYLLHPNLTKYINIFKKYETENVEILTAENIIYSKMFNECSMLITDYSSIHFDTAYLNKPIIYFQYDKEDYFKNHYANGYFDYEKDGFGDVVYNITDLRNKVYNYLENDCKIDNKYRSRIKSTFINLDRNNCLRNFEEINKIYNENNLNYRFNNVH